MSRRVSVATLNLRYTADRWDARLPLILEEMRSLQPDLLGLQECIYPLQQDRVVGTAGPSRYRTIRGWAYEVEMGNSLLMREPVVATDEARWDLGEARSAISAHVNIEPGLSVRAVSAQLHHRVGDDDIRIRQVSMLTERLKATRADEIQLVLGSFNAQPDEGAYDLMLANGFRSAYREVHGQEPASTWPTGRPTDRTEGRARRQGSWLAAPEPGIEPPGCFDYIWVRGPIDVETCSVVFDRASASDPTLFPSDHVGLAATLVVATGR